MVAPYFPSHKATMDHNPPPVTAPLLTPPHHGHHTISASNIPPTPMGHSTTSTASAHQTIRPQHQCHSCPLHPQVTGHALLSTSPFPAQLTVLPPPLPIYCSHRLQCHQVTMPLLPLPRHPNHYTSTQSTQVKALMTLLPAMSLPSVNPTRDIPHLPPPSHSEAANDP
ncbi:target of Nesh-SH3 [Platysternon megacephalum]|uniref:Target of Nesh-SH3 n=1 Tax=Platysternon megacephalum TaxID=55544 RepID=A0A4D9EF71_9SAUR|nr:target of Nesh-SH3 [Platysternon megacephalum]